MSTLLFLAFCLVLGWAIYKTQGLIVIIPMAVIIIVAFAFMLCLPLAWLSDRITGHMPFPYSLIP